VSSNLDATAVRRALPAAAAERPRGGHASSAKLYRNRHAADAADARASRRAASRCIEDRHGLVL